MIFVDPQVKILRKLDNPPKTLQPTLLKVEPLLDVLLFAE